MTNFKGTKGEWLKYRKTDQHNVEEIRTIEGKSICLIANNDESEYNAKLISCSPEMLECIEDLLKELRYHGFNNSNSIYKAEELIKKATE